MKVKDQVILPPAGVHSCPGNGAVHDLQLGMTVYMILFFLAAFKQVY